MRCPNCGGLNPDKTAYCINCGRDLTQQPVVQQQQMPQPMSRPGYQAPTQPRPVAPGYQPAMPLQRPTYPPPANIRTAIPQQTPPPEPKRQRAPENPPVRKHGPEVKVDYVAPFVPEAPDAPSLFPPKTVTQLKQLETGALPYKVIDDSAGYGKKKIVRIVFRRCVGWQQIATLYKALQEYDAEKFDTVVMQGVIEQETNVYAFTNGQLVFDRHVRLGSQELQRYQLETDNGFAAEAVRVVLTE